LQVARKVAVKVRGWEGCGALPELQVARKVTVKARGWEGCGALPELQVARKVAVNARGRAGKRPRLARPLNRTQPGMVDFARATPALTGPRSARITRTLHKVPGGAHEKAHGGGAVAITFLLSSLSLARGLRGTRRALRRLWSPCPPLPGRSCLFHIRQLKRGENF